MTTVLILGGGPAGCAAAYFLGKRRLTDIIIIEEVQTNLGCRNMCVGN